MRRTCFAMLIGTTALVPVAAVAQTGQQPAAQPRTGAAAQTGEARPLTAATFRNQPVYNQSGQEFGRVTSVMRGGNDQIFAVVTAAGNRQVLVPIERIAFDANRYVLRGYNEEQLRALTEYREGVGGYRPVEAEQRLAIAGAPGQQTAQTDGTNIVVQQPAPTIRVDQAAPQVQVQQPQPQVTVRQPTPEILVRQPAPTVTVDIPQPEITLRMPRPDVDVAMAQPQVEVRQPQPQVRVAQPQQQPQVQVERAQPQVLVQAPANRDPNVQIQGAEAQPQVRYERAEPRVVVNQAPGQPQVRVERLGEGQQAAAQQQAGTQQQAGAQQRGAVRTEQQRRAYQQQFGGGVETTGALGSAGTPRALRIADIADMDVYNARGERLGEVERVIMNPADNRRYLILSHGGFLGLGEDQVAFPLERFAMRGNDRLVIRGVTEQDIEAMDNWRNQVANYRNLGDADQVSLPTMQ